MPEPTRQYIFTEGQIRAFFAGVTALMVLGLVVLLLLISARPQGNFTTVDARQFEGTVERAARQLSGYGELDGGLVRIDIDRAIELVAERGVNDAFTARAAAQAGADGAAETAATGLPDGSQVYANCAGCHQANGQGVPGAFPPLSGHAAELYQADREYLAQVVLFGLRGAITVDGTQYNGVMPDWRSLSDEQIAAVLNYVLNSWENAEIVDEEQPYAAEEINELRGQDLTPQEVHDIRAELDLP
jgi:mono/diheme cytochrome c family protein